MVIRGKWDGSMASVFASIFLILPLSVCLSVCLSVSVRILEYHPMWMSIRAALQTWLKMLLNVCFGFCESLVAPLKGAVGLFS